tara:strand:- start:3689 stop:4630 length:942 start_codon:yes stop_codon:yes gene_type:complete
MSEIIGVFSRYSLKKDNFLSYHCSPCKIYKIMEEMKKIYRINYLINNYEKEYKFAIVDRIKPAKRIKAKHILNISETQSPCSWSTHNCFISPRAKELRPNDFILMNYCHGKKISAKRLSQDRDGGVYMGRLTKLAELKIIELRKVVKPFFVYPIKYWVGKRDVLRFHKEDQNYLKNLKFLQNKNPNINFLTPLNHNSLYKGLNAAGYKFGFVPSIYGFESRKNQAESSSKFFEYIGSGMPVLIESNVPEAIIVKNNPFLGEVYSGKSDMIKKAKKLNSLKYKYLNILGYANLDHFPDSRAKLIYDKFILQNNR